MQRQYAMYKILYVNLRRAHCAYFVSKTLKRNYETKKKLIFVKMPCSDLYEILEKIIVQKIIFLKRFVNCDLQWFTLHELWEISGRKVKTKWNMKLVPFSQNYPLTGWE